MILKHNRQKGELSLSTKKLEPIPGAMIRYPKLVFEKVILEKESSIVYTLLCAKSRAKSFNFVTF